MRDRRATPDEIYARVLLEIRENPSVRPYLGEERDRRRVRKSPYASDEERRRARNERRNRLRAERRKHE